MANPSSYPPGCSGGIEVEELVYQSCMEGHLWRAAMWYELGGWFYFDEEIGPVCPHCGDASMDRVITDDEISAYQMSGREIPIQGKLRR